MKVTKKVQRKIEAREIADKKQGGKSSAKAFRMPRSRNTSKS